MNITIGYNSIDQYKYVLVYTGNHLVDCNGCPNWRAVSSASTSDNYTQCTLCRFKGSATFMDVVTGVSL